MKRTIQTAIIFLSAAVAISCTKMLDLTPTDRVSDRIMWENTENAEMAVNYVYSYTYDVYADQCAVGLTEALTDMMKYGSYNYNALCFIPSEFAYGDPTNMTVSYVDTYMGYWASQYYRIRKTNESTYYLNQFGKMSNEDKTRLQAELRFVRAYLYFDLMKRYKEIILYGEDLTALTKNKKLATEKEGWDFIQKDLDFAAENLPEKAAAGGRVDKGAAYAFLTRAMLYAKRYDAVIAAAEKVKELGYELEDNYADGYSKAVKNGNIEAILQYHFDRADNLTHSFDFYYTPGGDYTLNGQAGGGYGTPTQELVESYELAAGGKPDWTPWHGETTAEPPYESLEPRFHATILYNGASWKGRKIESFVGGADGFCEWNIEPKPEGRTTTGYYLRKGVDENHDVIKESGSVQDITILRYAEVLLNKAEALYRNGRTQEANDIVNDIRDRVGLPKVTVDGAELWNAIRQERKVELAFEGLWYWDLRRWEVAHKEYPEGLSGYMAHGIKITGNETDGFKYSYVSVDDKNRNFPEKLYRFPMPLSEKNSNSEVDQYPEWR